MPSNVADVQVYEFGSGMDTAAVSIWLTSNEVIAVCDGSLDSERLTP